MREDILLMTGLLLLITLLAAASTTTAQTSRTDILKAEWNYVICIAIRILQIVAVGIAALIIMVAGLKYLTSDDPDGREESRRMITRVLTVLFVIAITVQVVNYFVSGTKIGRLDLESCSDLFPTSTQVIITTTTVHGSTTTTFGNGTTTTTTTTGTTTSTTIAGCTDPGSKYSIYGDSNACQRASSIDLCNTDYVPKGGNGMTELDEALGAGFSQCCCDNAYPRCCPPWRKMP